MDWGQVHLHIGTFYQATGDYQKACFHLFEALRLARDYGYKPLEAQSLMQIGHYYVNIRASHEALKYLSNALAIGQKSNDENRILRIEELLNKIHKHEDVNGG